MHLLSWDVNQLFKIIMRLYNGHIFSLGFDTKINLVFTKIKKKTNGKQYIRKSNHMSNTRKIPASSHFNEASPWKLSMQAHRIDGEIN